MNKNLKPEIRTQVESFKSLAQNETVAALAAAGGKIGEKIKLKWTLKVKTFLVKFVWAYV